MWGRVQAGGPACEEASWAPACAGVSAFFGPGDRTLMGERVSEGPALVCWLSAHPLGGSAEACTPPAPGRLCRGFLGPPVLALASAHCRGSSQASSPLGGGQCDILVNRGCSRVSVVLCSLSVCQAGRLLRCTPAPVPRWASHRAPAADWLPRRGVTAWVLAGTFVSSDASPQRSVAAV